MLSSTSLLLRLFLAINGSEGLYLDGVVDIRVNTVGTLTGLTPVISLPSHNTDQHSCTSNTSTTQTFHLTHMLGEGLATDGHV